MRRRGTVSRKPSKTQRRQPTRPKRSNAPTAARQHTSSVHNLQDKLDARTRELNEAIQRENASAEVLRIISSSPGDLQPVFDAILENATRICEAKFGLMHRYDGDAFHITALQGTPPDYAAVVRREAVRPGPETVLARMTRTKQVTRIEDAKAERGYAERDPMFVAAVERGNVRTILGVPMLKDNELVGAIVIYRQQVHPFTDKQIELVKSFAAQAVIAIENARLLNELRESLQQQTATVEVLRVISSSPGELEPVFEAMLANAARICEAKFGALYLSNGDGFRTVALHGAPPEFAEARRREPVIRPAPKTALGRAVAIKQTVQIADAQVEPGYFDDVPQGLGGPQMTRLGGARTIIAVPMLKDNELVGAIVIYRQEVRPFTGKQIGLLTNFASQAVIAIENARLLKELRESLQQQTATADVLKVISSSPGELEPVFQTMLANATRICEASFGNLMLHAALLSITHRPRTPNLTK